MLYKALFYNKPLISLLQLYIADCYLYILKEVCSTLDIKLLNRLKYACLVSYKSLFYN
jgi:hypothetical protein